MKEGEGGREKEREGNSIGDKLQNFLDMCTHKRPRLTIYGGIKGMRIKRGREKKEKKPIEQGSLSAQDFDILYVNNFLFSYMHFFYPRLTE